jgi:hypothetical protein
MLNPHAFIKLFSAVSIFDRLIISESRSPLGHQH